MQSRFGQQSAAKAKAKSKAKAARKFSWPCLFAMDFPIDIFNGACNASFHRYPSFHSAVPDLVRAAGVQDPEEVERLVSIYQNYMRDVHGWSRCVASHEYRPSMASWRGLAWELNDV